MTAHRLRSALAAAAIAATGLGLYACGGDEPVVVNPSPPAGTPPPPASASSSTIPTPAGAPKPGTNPKRPAFASAAECGQCHREIYAEWKASWHGQAMVDPLFLRISEGLKQEECIRCHAPVPLREAENWETPIARSDRREDAISCLTCHQAGGHVTGPFEGLSGACRPIHDADQRDPTKMCFACHNQHKTGEEWQAGPYAPEAAAPRKREAQTCIDCHMPWVDRPLVPGGPVRHGRRHTWPGGHDMSQLVKAAKLEIETTPQGEGTRVRTWVTNVGAGHNIPTDARHRSFDVYVKVWDENDQVVIDPLDADPRKQDATQTAKYRLNYRNSNLPDTQVAPLERASGLPKEGTGPGTWRGYVDVPVKKGRGEMWLVYRMTPEDVLVPESLTDPVFKAYRARRVAMIPFTFGEGR